MLQNNLILKILQKELLALSSYLHPYFLQLLSLFNAYSPLLLIVISVILCLILIYWIVKLYLLLLESNKPATIFEVSPPTLTEQSSFTTTQLFTSVHGLLRQRSWLLRLFDVTKSYSFEIISTKDKGIRYLLRLSVEDAQIIKKNLIAYLPGVEVKETNDYTQCPHKVWRDRFGPQAEKSQESNPFVELLWEKGVSHEKDVVASLQLMDLSSIDKADQFSKTLEAMNNKVPLIYHGYLQFESLSGEPDLLRLEPDGTYIPIDIKSGQGFEGTTEDSEENGKLKKHYALQLAHYCELLSKLGFGSKHKGIILDSQNQEVVYDLDLPQGVKNQMTWWQLYEQTRYIVSRLMTNQTQNKPAYSSLCKLCPWYQSCKKWCVEANDPTMIAYLGRAGRDTLMEDLEIKDAKDLCNINVDALISQKQKDKSFLPRIGEKQLQKYKFRAQINYQLKTPQFKPFPPFPKVNHELFFDIEDDPTQEFVYLHGVYERTLSGERFLDGFVAADNTREAEKEAWAKFVRYVKSLPSGDFCLYYYSKHERTTYRKMQGMYPDVIDANELETWFVPPIGIDLYFDYIFKYTEWPLPSYSLKEIAHYLEFNWRDKTPSGALSIQWFNEYLADKDPAKLKRILDYNEDDCKATMVIKDYLDKVTKFNEGII